MKNRTGHYGAALFLTEGPLRLIFSKLQGLLVEFLGGAENQKMSVHDPANSSGKAANFSGPHDLSAADGQKI